MCEKDNIKVRQAVPYDHRRGLGSSEGLNRWLQDCAQAHMNRISVYVNLGLMTEHDKRSLWFHALTYANDVKLLAPSKTDPTKTQYEEGQKVKFNFSYNVMLLSSNRLDSSCCLLSRCCDVHCRWCSLDVCARGSIGSIRIWTGCTDLAPLWCCMAWGLAVRCQAAPQWVSQLGTRECHSGCYRGALRSPWLNGAAHS